MTHKYAALMRDIAETWIPPYAYVHEYGVSTYLTRINAVSYAPVERVAEALYEPLRMLDGVDALASLVSIPSLEELFWDTLHTRYMWKALEIISTRKGPLIVFVRRQIIPISGAFVPQVFGGITHEFIVRSITERIVDHHRVVTQQ